MDNYTQIYQVAIIIWIIQAWISFAEGTTCFHCDQIPFGFNVSTCAKTVKCAQNQVCAATILHDNLGKQYHRLGCIDLKDCGSGDPLLIGKRNTISCINCCIGENCNTQPCNVQPQETCSSWENWTPCDVTCGSGKQSRQRQCVHSSQQTIKNEMKTCNNQDCTDDKACKDVYEHCNSPDVMGTLCSSSKMAVQFCAMTCGYCPVNGQWSQWSAWSGCTASCGSDAHRLRLRLCNNPEPKHNGTYCVGPDRELSSCATSCPVDGSWSHWSTWSSCSHTCGNGIKNRHRTCSNPPPAHGGKNCSGSAYDSTGCRDSVCALQVDGGWAAWSNWTQCSATCGVGKTSRFRTCSNPVPKNGGKACKNPAHFIESKSCGANDCPVDGDWSDWSPWHQCSVTCGGGKSFRSRSCSNPVPTNGGKPCKNPASFIERKSCGEVLCSVTASVTTSKAPTTLASYSSTGSMPPSHTHAHSLVPAVGCNDVDFCSDTRSQQLLCQDIYIATTYCPKMCGLCGVTNAPAACVDSVGGSCHDPLYIQFACNDNELAALCAKTCGVCH
ncbi:coadhesin-like isoform X2 [Ruditapes philippinarum]|uniref:coadhesin-like isoform X2 n=1 Tax=Ruditapes philippinarum TaxID=129788 RepID=UPI00295C147E|nr:coadhesin-like isoform X2 [Ruditapes philippinarum]